MYARPRRYQLWASFPSVLLAIAHSELDRTYQLRDFESSTALPFRCRRTELQVDDVAIRAVVGLSSGQADALARDCRHLVLPRTTQVS